MRNGIKDLVPESVKTADQLINEFSFKGTQWRAVLIFSHKCLFQTIKASL